MNYDIKVLKLKKNIGCFKKNTIDSAGHILSKNI